MDLPPVAVALIVPSCALYAAWKLAPSALRRRAARHLLGPHGSLADLAGDAEGRGQEEHRERQLEERAGPAGAAGAGGRARPSSSAPWTGCCPSTRSPARASVFDVQHLPAITIRHA